MKPFNCSVLGIIFTLPFSH